MLKGTCLPQFAEPGIGRKLFTAAAEAMAWRVGPRTMPEPLAPVAGRLSMPERRTLYIDQYNKRFRRYGLSYWVDLGIEE